MHVYICEFLYALCSFFSSLINRFVSKSTKIYPASFLSMVLSNAVNWLCIPMPPLMWMLILSNCVLGIKKMDGKDTFLPSFCDCAVRMVMRYIICGLLFCLHFYLFLPVLLKTVFTLMLRSILFYLINVVLSDCLLVAKFYQV